MNVKIITLGCKVNQYESEAMMEALENAGFSPYNEADENVSADSNSIAINSDDNVNANNIGADVIILNSCTVTAESDRKVRQTLRRERNNNPSAIVILTGCMPQAFPEESQKFLEADIVLGNQNRGSLLTHITNFLASKQRIIDIAPHENGEKFEKFSLSNFSERTRAFVKIEDGCNRFCSYCIIPFARGRVRSKPLDELKAEIHTLAENGYKEIVLTGINLCAYGQDLGLHLCDAVEAACSENKIERIRLSSLEPEQLSKDVIARLAKQKKLCPQFHLSLQSGCNETLARMKRHYTTDDYREIVKNLREAFENAAVTTDIMVGFAGETDEEFQKSLAFSKEISFAKVHVFAYSKRPGTAAYDYKNQILNKVKSERSKQMIAVTLDTQQDFFKKQVNLTEQVLFESVQNGVYSGYTPNYTPVKVTSDTNLTGQILPVQITEVCDGYCKGSVKFDLPIVI